MDRPTWTFDDHNYLFKGPQNLTAIHTLAKTYKLLPCLPSAGGQGQINPPSWSRAQDHGILTRSHQPYALYLKISSSRGWVLLSLGQSPANGVGAKTLWVP